MRILSSIRTGIKNSAANLSIYFLAALIPMLLSLLSNPFLAKNLSPEDYAIIGYYGAFNTLFTPLVNFYLIHYYTKRYFELGEDERLELKTTLFKSLIFFSLLMAFIALGLIYVYTICFNKETQLDLWPYALLSTMSVPLLGIFNLTLADYRMGRRSKSFFKLSVYNGIIACCLAILLVVVIKGGAIGRLTATLVSSAIIFGYLICKNHALLKVSFSKDIFVHALGFCYPLVIASMLSFFCAGYDKLVLEHRGDIYALGIYSVGVTIAGYLHVFSNTINDTFQPDIFESMIKRKFHRCFKFVALKLGIMSVCVGVFWLFAPLVIDILTFGRYSASTPFARIVSLSAISSMMYYSVSQITIALGFTKITLYNKIIGSIASIISFDWLIGNYGAAGAAWGMVLSYIYFLIGNIIMVLIKYRTVKRR